MPQVLSLGIPESFPQKIQGHVADGGQAAAFSGSLGEDPLINIKRVEGRIAAGGHDVLCFAEYESSTNVIGS